MAELPFQPTKVLTNEAYQRASRTADGLYTNDPQVNTVLGRRRLADLAEPRGEDNFLPLHKRPSHMVTPYEAYALKEAASGDRSAKSLLQDIRNGVGVGHPSNFNKPDKGKKPTPLPMGSAPSRRATTSRRSSKKGGSKKRRFKGGRKRSTSRRINKRKR